MNKALVSFSGGMDSATVLAYMVAAGWDVTAVSFTYGSKHNEHESKAAEAFCRHYNVPRIFIDMAAPFSMFKSDLLKTGGNIPEGHYTDSTMSATVVPGRNIIFFSMLAGLAWSLEARAVACGIHQGDHAIYEDCRPQFYEAMQLAIHHGTGERVELLAPFLKGDKYDILAWGFKNAVPYHLTRTCYKDQPKSCGKCGACQERLEAFTKHNQRDPIPYEGQVD